MPTYGICALEIKHERGIPLYHEKFPPHKKLAIDAFNRLGNGFEFESKIFRDELVEIEVETTPRIGETLSCPKLPSKMGTVIDIIHAHFPKISTVLVLLIIEPLPLITSEL